ncbi:hypothetical protein H4R21_000945 [Coemansia helicoidea]|uniref:Uncharacterized protein n=1 Tax=Coemansia helicoidea TaxID=1286919 RepID=A0ACC1LDE4_9FUNG|nr:hypothetical protein H4R21_000945 [Coemansia helicoidea]
MSSPGRLPELLTESQKTQELRTLRKRAQHLDKKWTLRCRKPDGITLLCMLPVVGGATSAALAYGYLQQISSTFELPRDVHDEIVNNILFHAAFSSIPFVGCITRRVRGINKKNYKIVEESDKERLRGYLNHKLQILCDDGRTFTGIFKCVDAQENFILADTTEVRDGE